MLDTDKLVNLIKHHAIAALNTILITKLGIVVNYDYSDANNYTADVAIQPDSGASTASSEFPQGLIARNCSILTPWGGNGWGFFAPPSLNDLVVVLFLEGNFSSGFIIGTIFNDQDRSVQITNPPGPKSGEFFLVHSSGSKLQFLNDGTVNINCTPTGNGDYSSVEFLNNGQITINCNVSGGAETNLNLNANVVINGNLTVQGSGAGNISATGNVLDNSGTNTDNMAGMRNVYNNHHHGGVSTGGGNTLGPSSDM